MTTGVRVGIVIPSYNLHGFLAETLRSVLAQEFTAWEVIVVDDCSTSGDDPGEVLAKMSDPRVRLLRHTVNRGLGAARNTGFDATAAELVLPLDGDDLLTPDFLAKLVAWFDANAALDAVFSDFELFGAQTGRRAHRLRELSDMTADQWLPGAGVLMKRTLWARAGRYSEHPTLRLGNEDWDFWLRAADAGFRAAHVPEALYRYRQHDASMSHGLKANDHVTRRFLLEQHRAFFAQHGGARDFLANGFWRSAEKARHQRRFPAALGLITRAVATDRDWGRARSNVSQLLRACFRSAPAVPGAKAASPPSLASSAR